MKRTFGDKKVTSAISITTPFSPLPEFSLTSAKHVQALPVGRRTSGRSLTARRCQGLTFLPPIPSPSHPWDLSGTGCGHRPITRDYISVTSGAMQEALAQEGPTVSGTRHVRRPHTDRR
ncbi:hypothetical protein PoB_000197300 [Plakobranchus ocellatus]|uniref:Uncharacterized protein n=1 Tax=Plakobranchus ocellatus TaxID=259542 RepID=A0AAV3XYN1_9GAST|nr:hypothetical protein PoB_000197300 [Plakobranchus ocellatus]